MALGYAFEAALFDDRCFPRPFAKPGGGVTMMVSQSKTNSVDLTDFGTTRSCCSISPSI
jgi:hypothetical protein